MKKVLIKELRRSIWRTKNRFLSILAIVAVGTGFFAGLKASCPDMKDTAARYFDDTRLMDIHLISTLGFSDEDLDAVKGTGNLRGVMPAYSVDAFVTGEEGNLIVKALSIPLHADTADENYLNRPVLVEGRMPQKSGECLVESSSFAATEYAVGSTITLFLEEEDGKNPLSDTLKTETFTVVGAVESSSYISFTRGNSLIGDGSIDAFVLLPEEDFALDVYTDVYLTLENTVGVSPYADKYDELIEAQTQKLEQVAEVRARERYDEIVDEAQAEIDKAKAELADGEQKADKELREAEKKLKDAKAELAQGKADYEEGRLTFQTEIADAKQQLADGEQKLAAGREEYETGLAEYQEGYAAFLAQKPAAEEEIRTYEAQRDTLQQQLTDGENQLRSAKTVADGISGLLTAYQDNSIPNPADFPEEIKALLAAADALTAENNQSGILPSQVLTLYLTTDSPIQKSILSAQIRRVLEAINTELAEQEATLAQGKAGLAELVAGIEAGKAELSAAEEELAAAKAQLETAETELKTGEAELQKNRARLAEEEKSGRQELADAKAKLTKGETEYQNGLKEYEDGKAKAEKRLDDARDRIKDAENQLAELAEPVWYVWNRDSNPGYAEYQADAEKVDAIAQVFPVFFVLVAALVCLTTMTRMVEEERTQIGTLKALGYGKGSIMTKYLLYAILASVLGSAIGLIIGFQLFPRVIIAAYKIMYTMPEPMTPFKWDYAAACTAVAVACTGLSALAACYKALRSCPAQLMRPRAPKSGKRILLERINFLWSRLSFIYKVTLRNIFRYKRRAAMTIIGVAGCTALILTGFGMRDSITSIADKQYGYLFTYDAIAVAEQSTADTTALKALIHENNEVEQSMMLMNKSVDITDGEVIKTANLYVPQEPAELRSFINLQKRLGNDKLELTDDGVILTEKLAKMVGAKVGERVTINNPDGRPITVQVTGIAENYAMHFIYMTPTLYEKEFRVKTEYNTALLNLKDGTDTGALAERLLADGSFLGVSCSDEIMQQFVDTMDSLNSIVWVLIISAGALAIIVMYNLVSISVNERIRELATIKVLGFYDKETSAYIYRENNIAAGIGLVVGLIVGIFFERFVIKTAEVEAVMFSPEISPLSFLYAALLTIFFILLVTITLYFQLKKISMVESLKSVE